jgi:hypothetical protein
MIDLKQPLLSITIEVLYIPSLLPGKFKLIVGKFSLLGGFTHPFKLLKVRKEDILLL